MRGIASINTTAAGTLKAASFLRQCSSSVDSVGHRPARTTTKPTGTSPYVGEAGEAARDALKRYHHDQSSTRHTAGHPIGERLAVAADLGASRELGLEH